jgi:hypothetical protein
VSSHFTSYTIRILSQRGDVDRDLEVICASDRDVQLVAHVISRPCGLEIWDGDRLVASFPPVVAKAA